MVSAETIHSYSFRNSEFNNYYYNRPTITLMREEFLPFYYTSSKLLFSSFFSAEVQLLPLKPIFTGFFLSTFFIAVLILLLVSNNLWPDIF